MRDLTKLSNADLQELYRQGAGSAAPGKKVSYSAPLWDAAEAAAAEKTGVPVEVMRTIRTVGERSNGDQVSPKGARGVYQFIPSSRDAFLKKYGIDAYSEDPAEQALATAHHLKESYDRTGSWDKAMAGFNGGISAEKGTNATTENRDYASRTSAALAGAPGRTTKGGFVKTMDKIADVLIPAAQAAENNPLASMSDEELKAAYAASAGAQVATQAGASSGAHVAAERSAMQSLAHGVGVGARGLVVGAAELPGMVTDAVTGPINTALDYYHDNRAPTAAELVTGKQTGFRFRRAGAATDSLLTQAGMPQS